MQRLEAFFSGKHRCVWEVGVSNVNNNVMYSYRFAGHPHIDASVHVKLPCKTSNG